ncbi:nicotinate-nucleotide adenylyltransferase [Natranaerofaba carboxydovora]|uniref:nicotinate-nucleotide adenylyltransferase n=1 Tax=Natranaerofaba carboxydovora TaxID=2742683 RepID=UPI001F12BC45|nr:nicotinate-nucleotide adenylyltransferase [Natranaerofaba carboxydovora]UMZ72885.1 putative nicotinate-nucleotide adenylyltransferase [Natranaerofaba carboxydovora]
MEAFIEDKPITLGIMGGTFDPIHNGHLILAQEALNNFGLDHVVFMPSGIPPHKDAKKVTAAEERYMLTVLATIENPNFSVNRYELEREGRSYSIHTLEYFQNILPKGSELYFITGLDILLDITTWKDYERVLDLCTFICARRPDFSFEELDKNIISKCPKIKWRVKYMDIPLMQISSTDIRDRCKKKKSIKYLVPSNVEEYIKKNGLYK